MSDMKKVTLGGDLPIDDFTGQPMTKWGAMVNDNGDVFAWPLTQCCEASGKGWDFGMVVCRACMAEVSYEYGMPAPKYVEDYIRAALT